MKEDNGRIETTSAGVPATTIWDYKRFRHREFPADVSSTVFSEQNDTPPLIDRDTPIASIGSCFARNVAQYLMENGYNYLVTEEPFQQASAHWDQVFNTACMRQIFEYTFTETWKPTVRWWPKEEHVQDPYRRDILYDRATCEKDFTRHRAASRRALGNAEVIICTLGLIETWRDKRDHMTYYRVPSPSVYDPEIHEFYVQVVSDCLHDLKQIHHLLSIYNPEASLIVTVSPVPLFATFRTDTDVVSANALSKSTLRTAAEYFTHQYENAFYFPSYEYVQHGISQPWEDDNRHVTDDAISQVMHLFEQLFVRQ